MFPEVAPAEGYLGVGAVSEHAESVSRAVQSFPALAAALASDLAGVMRVLQGGMDPNMADTGGLTLLHRCADVTTPEFSRIVSVKLTKQWGSALQ